MKMDNATTGDLGRESDERRLMTKTVSKVLTWEASFWFNP
jgi:hypothetical protein